MAQQKEIVLDNDELQICRLALGPFSTNAYLITCKETGLKILVDAPGDADILLEEAGVGKVKYIVITHSHVDHIGALTEVKEALQTPLAAHKADSPALPVTPDFTLQGGEILEVGRLKLSVIHTPGHTPGSICLYTGSVLLAGDTLFPGGPGKTWSPADFKELIASLQEKIFALPAETQVFPGHGSSTTIGAERESFEEFLAAPHPDDLHGDVTWKNR